MPQQRSNTVLDYGAQARRMSSRRGALACLFTDSTLALSVAAFAASWVWLPLAAAQKLLGIEPGLGTLLFVAGEFVIAALLCGLSTVGLALSLLCGQRRRIAAAVTLTLLAFVPPALLVIGIVTAPPRKLPPGPAAPWF